MKRTISTVTLLLLLLLPLAVGFLVVDVAKANPSYSSTPIAPNKDPPVLTVESPSNATYWNLNDVSLSLAVTQPDSWNESNRITEVSYLLDGQEVIMWDGNHGTLHGAPSIDWFLPKTSNFSTELRGLTTGTHTLQVNVQAESDYFPNLPAFKFPSTYTMNVSQKIDFTISTSSDIPEFPSWAILPLFIIATLIAIMVYKSLLSKSLTNPNTQ